MPDGNHNLDLVITWNSQIDPGTALIETCHRVSRQPHGSGLKQQVLRGQAGIKAVRGNGGAGGAAV